MIEAAHKDDVLLGARVRKACLGKNLTQKYIGDMFHISAQQIAKFEAGKNRISAKMLYRLSIMLNKPIGWFLQDLSDETMDELALDTKKRFSKQAISYFSCINDTKDQERILECLKVFAR